jgi:hypothetical protein
LDDTQVVLACILLATSAVLTGGFFIKKRNLSKKPGAWKKAGILYMIAGACFGSIILSYLIPFSFLAWLWSAVVGREAFINE